MKKRWNRFLIRYIFIKSTTYCLIKKQLYYNNHNIVILTFAKYRQWLFILLKSNFIQIKKNTITNKQKISHFFIDFKPSIVFLIYKSWDLYKHSKKSRESGLTFLLILIFVGIHNVFQIKKKIIILNVSWKKKN